MHRRAYLATAACLLGSAGCLASAPRSRPHDEDVPLARHGVPQSICDEEPRPSNAHRGIAEPAFAADWDRIDVPPEYRGTDRAGLAPDDTVIGVTDDGRARAYPLRILYRLEVVNDTFGGPLLVTFCPLCNSGMVASRVVDGEPSEFRMTGLLWSPPGVPAAVSADEGRVFGTSTGHPDADLRRSGNLVMIDDRTESYWSQYLARAICGPVRGSTLAIEASSTATWADWRSKYPSTEVLLPPPHSTPV